MEPAKESLCKHEAAKHPHPTGMSRRSFIVGAAGFGAVSLAALLGVSGCAPRLASEAADGASEEAPSYDIIIIGAGGAGMVAALHAFEAGARVLLLEKNASTGGNTNFAEGGMNASETRLQAENDILDSNTLFAEDTFIGGHEKGNRDLINHMCQNSSAAIDWLEDHALPLTKLGTSGGASVKRIHRPGDGSAVGQYLVTGLTGLCQESEIDILLQSDVEEILSTEGVISGVRVVSLESNKTTEYRAPAVIVAAGGFGANHEMLASYRPELLDAVTTNLASAQGDGIALAEALGAATVDMGEIQVHPTVEQNTAILLSEGIRGDGAVLINAEGKRFTNELLTRDAVTAIEWEQPGGWSYAVFDKEVYDANTSIAKKFEPKGLALQAESLEELATEMEVDVANFMDALTAYNSAIEAETVDPFGRTESRNLIKHPPFYAIKVAPGIHHTMGGIKIDTQAQVIDTTGNVIPGLFAAGEVTGGIHGGNRLGGNAVCDINVYGAQAARSALSFVGL
ncbi:MAG: flavocytochrome c [Coriobacteriales bacterium]|jgi:fumarate reductase flavoprotein subunit|nr:flavocytochrome c [Coriobacteriales bacterium]